MRRSREAYGQQRGLPKSKRRSREAYGQQRGLQSSQRRAAPSGIFHSTKRQVGDIVQRADVDRGNRYVIVDIRGPWIYTRRISGSGGPGIVTFPSQHMLRKVD